MRNTYSNLSFFKGKNILITGASGYIGSSVAKALSKTSSNLNILSRKNGDITNIKTWQKALKNTQIVFHFAAQTSSYFANTNPYEDMRSNILPIIHLLSVCQKHRYTPIVIFAGTATQRGLTQKKPTSENEPDYPITIYDIHKLTAEKYLQYYANQLGNRSVTLRLPNIYGPGPESSKQDRGIVNLLVKKALRGETLTIYGSGSYVRDYLYIDDVVSAFLLAAIKIQKTSGKYYVIGSGKGFTIKKMVSLIQKKVALITKKRVSILRLPFPTSTSPIEYRQYIANPKRFINDTNWSATITLDQGIEKTIRYYL